MENLPSKNDSSPIVESASMSICTLALLDLDVRHVQVRDGLRGQAGERQVPGAPKVGYTQLYGAPGTAGVSILSI
jgi:hypothetical protein